MTSHRLLPLLPVRHQSIDADDSIGKRFGAIRENNILPFRQRTTVAVGHSFERTPVQYCVISERRPPKVFQIHWVILRNCTAGSNNSVLGNCGYEGDFHEIAGPGSNGYTVDHVVTKI